MRLGFSPTVLKRGIDVRPSIRSFRVCRGGAQPLLVCCLVCILVCTYTGLYGHLGVPSDIHHCGGLPMLVRFWVAAS